MTDIKEIFNKNTKIFLPIILAIGDYIAVMGSVYIAYIVRKNGIGLDVHPEFYINELYIYFIVPVFFLLMFILCDTYKLSLSYWDNIKSVCKSVMYGGVVAVFLMYFTQVSGSVSRLFIGMAILFIFINILIMRYIIGRVLIKVGLFKIPVIIIGGGETAKLLLKSLYRNPIMRYSIVGFIDDNPLAPALNNRFSLLGTFDDIDDVIASTGVENVIVCAPGLEAKKLIALIVKLEALVKNVSFIPELIGIPAANLSVQGFMEENMILVNVKNNLASGYNRIIKRSFDFIVTLLSLIVFFPIGIMIAIIIYIADPGPILYVHKRIGQDGNLFDCYKFRSMYINNQEILNTYLSTHPELESEWKTYRKLRGEDPRVMPIGKILRKYSLDELPQLLNVLKGDMSLVGPRPYLQEEVPLIGANTNTIFMVKPGITGYWQVNGRSDVTFQERVEMESWYVYNWSLWIDLVILWKTIKIVLMHDGAY